MPPAIFLDRDDTLTEDMAYSADPELLRLKPHAAEATRMLREAGYAIVVVTNQSGVARGCFSETELSVCHRRLREMMRDSGAPLDAIYYCPYLNSSEATVEVYRRDSELRKPQPGMLLQAADDLAIELSESWMIGDAPRDIEAGAAAGCRTILIPREPEATTKCSPDFVASNMLQAAQHILANPSRAIAPDSRVSRDSSERHTESIRDDEQVQQRAGSDRNIGREAAGNSSDTVSAAATTQQVMRGSTSNDTTITKNTPASPGTTPPAGATARLRSGAANELTIQPGVTVPDTAARIPSESASPSDDAADQLSKMQSQIRAFQQTVFDSTSGRTSHSGTTDRNELHVDVEVPADSIDLSHDEHSNRSRVSQAIGVVAQTVAATLLLWALSNLFSGTPAKELEMWFLAAIAFQLVAMTYFWRR